MKHPRHKIAAYLGRLAAKATRKTLRGKKHVIGILASVLVQAATAATYTYDVPATYPTIQAAVNAVPSNSADSYTIQIAPGSYNEAVLINTGQNNITILGTGSDYSKVVIWNNITNATNSYTGALRINGNDITVENLTLQNTAGASAGQANALYSGGQRISFKNVRVTGYQDTALITGGPNYFCDSEIAGSVDFIWHGGTAYFENCTITQLLGGGDNTAPSTASTVTYGFVFSNCYIAKASGVAPSSSGLMRPYGAYGETAYLGCTMDDHITAAGWDAWNGNELTCRAAEYKSTTLGGALIDLSTRSSWVVRLTDAQAATYSKANVLGGWNPPVSPDAVAAPSNLAATAVSVSQINLTWTNNATTATSVLIERSSDNVAFDRVGSVASNVTSYSDTSLLEGVTYYYRVRADDSGSLSPDSNTASSATQGSAFYRVNSAGPAVSPFAADADYSGGSTYSTGAAIDTSAVASPAPMEVYQTERYNNFTYTFPGLTAGTNYKVRLHFAELYFSTSGSRVFDVYLNGTEVLTNFDIYAAAGAKNKAIVEEFTVPADSSGQIVVQYVNVVNNAKSSGIEILSADSSSVPIAPTGLTAAGANLAVNLNWTQSTSAGLTGNNVYRSTAGSGGPYNLLASLGLATSYSDTSVSTGATYYYSVTAVNGGGESAMSGYAGATTVPPAPAGLTATGGNAQVALSWTAASGATSYNVERATVIGGTYTTVATGVTATTYTDGGLAAGTAYYYVVQAVNAAGTSGNSTEAGATTQGAVAPNPPASLTAKALRTAGQIKLGWTQSTSANIASNKVYRSTTTGGAYALVATISASTSYTDTGRSTGTTYYYVVTAVNTAGTESAYSNEASATSK